MLVVAAGGCRQDVEVSAGETLIWGAPMGAHRLDPTPELAGYVHPTTPLTVDVSAPENDTELVFFPEDPEGSYTPFTVNSTVLGARTEATAVGYVHRGGQNVYYFGNALYAKNDFKPQSLAAVYQRDHGECELEVAWDTVLDQVVAQAPERDGTAKVVLKGCEYFPVEPECLLLPDVELDYTTTTHDAVAGSYLRREGAGARAGFGLFVKARAAFDSPLVPNLWVVGRGSFDLTLGTESDGAALGVARVEATGPLLAKAWCDGGAAYCPRSRAETEAHKGLATVVPTVNAALAECLAVPVAPDRECESALACATHSDAALLAAMASAEVMDRGGDEPLAESFVAVLRSEANWRCAPVTPECAAVVGTDPVATPTCQLRLQATEIIAMPESFSLVWHTEGAGREPVTTGQALFLALKQGRSTESLERLCSPLKTTNLDHRFAESRLEH